MQKKLMFTFKTQEKANKSRKIYKIFLRHKDKRNMN